MTGRSRHDEQGPRVPDVAGDVQAVRRWLEEGREGKRIYAPWQAAPKSVSAALDRLAALIGQLQRERDESAALAETRRISRSQYRARAERAEAALQRAQTGLRAAIEGLDLAAKVLEAIDMDDAEDEAIKMRAVGTMLLALVAARDFLAESDAALAEAGRVPEPRPLSPKKALEVDAMLRERYGDDYPTKELKRHEWPPGGRVPKHAPPDGEAQPTKERSACAWIVEALRLAVLSRPAETENRDTYADGYTSGLVEALWIARRASSAVSAEDATKAAPSEPEIHHAVSDPAPTDGRLTDAGSGSLGAEGAPPPEGTA